MPLCVPFQITRPSVEPLLGIGWMGLLCTVLVPDCRAYCHVENRVREQFPGEPLLLDVPEFPRSIVSRPSHQFPPETIHFQPLAPAASLSGCNPIHRQTPRPRATRHRSLRGPLDYSPMWCTKDPHQATDLATPEHVRDSCSIGSRAGGRPFPHERGSIQCTGYMRSDIHYDSPPHS